MDATLFADRACLRCGEEARSGGPCERCGFDATALAGEPVGPYRLDKPVGRGGMGLVFSARHERLGHRVAVKFLRGPSHEQERRSLHEARAAARVIDDRVVRVIDIGAHETLGAYLVMEYVDGRTLNAVTEGRPVAPSAALLLVRETALAVAAAHANDVIHRDLKPENIFVIARRGATPTVKVADFGIAKVVNTNDSSTTRGRVCGTPAYMSPEQWRGATVDARSDIYSLGVILFELLTGALPFNGTVWEVSYKTVHEAPPAASTLVPSVPDEVSALVLRCLQKDPGVRFPTALELVDALDALVTRLPPGEASPLGRLSLVPAMASVPPATAVTRRPTPDHGWLVDAVAPPRRVLALATALAALAACVAGGWFASRSATPEVNPAVRPLVSSPPAGASLSAALGPPVGSSAAPVARPDTQQPVAIESLPAVPPVASRATPSGRRAARRASDPLLFGPDSPSARDDATDDELLQR